MAISSDIPAEVANAGVTDKDRLGFTVFLALVLHAIIVFGISFAAEERQPAPHTVEVTLAQYEDQEAPEEADYVAQVNQRGSGTLEEKKVLTVAERAKMKDVEVREVSQVEPDSAVPRKEQKAKQVVVTRAETSDPVETGKTEKVVSNPEKKNKISLLQRSLEIASLEAQLAEKANAYAKRPRVTRLTAVSARQSSSAAYMDSWRREVERVGNLNYPEEARRRGLNGQVRVAVMLLPDGHVQKIDVLESSGYKILDDAVIRIIRLAEPFPPFTEAMRKESDLFEIIRTFSFGQQMSSF